MRSAVRLLAILSVAICLIPAGAHLFEMPNKLALPPAEYMVVQEIYAGWALFGIAIFAAIVSTLAHAILSWKIVRARVLSLLSLLAIVVTQLIFWTYTYPMNALTRNWTITPDELEAARRQWEHSHAANAVLTFIALALIVAAALAAEREEDGSDRGPPSFPERKQRAVTAQPMDPKIIPPD